MIGQRTSQRSFAGSVDWLLIISYLLLVTIGFMNVYSTVHNTYPDVFVWDSRACKQLVWIGSAFLLAIMILFVIPTRIYEQIAIPAYLGIFVLLVLVIFIGKETNGSHSWFELGPIKLQPAELSKITSSLTLAAIISKLDLKFKTFRDYLIAGAVMGLPMVAILAENETGSMLVYVGFLFVLYREGISGWWLFLLGLLIATVVVTLKFGPFWSLLLVGIAATATNEIVIGKGRRWFLIFLPIVTVLIVWQIIFTRLTAENPESAARFFDPAYITAALLAVLMVVYLIRGFRSLNGFKMTSVGAILACIIMVFSIDFLFDKVLQPHQQKRIEVLLGITEDRSGAGYNVYQSKVAIGSGGFFGRGYLNGTQSTYGFVPEQSTDFIFCTVGEEWGFLGCTAIILLYVLLISRIVNGAEKSRERFTRIYGYCVAACLFMHLMINVGMTIGLMPVIGIPLPLVSYGGSSLWAFTILIFIFVALDRNEKKYF
ncbi:MAG: rod shape-determining protein RodA [Bacteroidales bacterium]|nr:rod shape-determining protein RodA [Bacteroidales bacterium]